MWEGGSVRLSRAALLRTDRHTLESFRTRVCFSLECPKHVNPLRWTGMRRWFATRLREGSDLNAEVELEKADYDAIDGIDPEWYTTA